MNLPAQIPIDSYTQYDLDYLKFQINRNSNFLDLSIDKLQKITKNYSEKN